MRCEKKASPLDTHSHTRRCQNTCTRIHGEQSLVIMSIDYMHINIYLCLQRFKLLT